jgi:tRNA-2-methylthio-N6-dimethylallyladenosine synthase
MNRGLGPHPTETELTDNRTQVEKVKNGTYYIETYGCQMNDHDTEKMAQMLEHIGMTAVPAPDAAEVVIINTCSIREKAEHKVYSALGKLKPLKTENPGMVIIVAGCVAQQEKEKLLKKAGHLDVVLGTHSVSQLPKIVEQVKRNRSRMSCTEFSEDVQSLHMPAPCKPAGRICSYVTIMQGCSNFCSYCVVPFTRGPEQSRRSDEIVQEVHGLVEKGIREITLLGQNVNAYGNDLSNGDSFTGLLERLDHISNLKRIRFTTSHPRDFNEDLASAMANLRSVCEHIHLPLQSGSDRILRAMRRGYTLSEYVQKIAMLRYKIPGVAVTADMIVGFPGETEEDFQQTLDALKRIRFDQIFSFKYSLRPSTAARKMPDHVPEVTKVERLERVHTVQAEITGEYHRSAEGTVEEILIEGIRTRSLQAFGRTRTNKIVNLEESGNVKEGDVMSVKITRGLKHSLLGRRMA